MKGFCISLNELQRLKQQPLRNTRLRKAAFIGPNPVRVKIVICFLTPHPLMEIFTSQYRKYILVTSAAEGTSGRWKRQSPVTSLSASPSL